MAILGIALLLVMAGLGWFKGTTGCTWVVVALFIVLGFAIHPLAPVCIAPLTILFAHLAKSTLRNEETSASQVRTHKAHDEPREKERARNLASELQKGWSTEEVMWALGKPDTDEDPRPCVRVMTYCSGYLELRFMNESLEWIRVKDELEVKPTLG